MGYVAATTSLFALGAYQGGNVVGAAGVLAFIAAIASLIGMQFAVKRSRNLTIALLAAFGLLLGLATAPTLANYASADPGYPLAGWRSDRAVHRGLRCGGLRHPARSTAIARVGSWALVALIAFGIVLIFVQIPGGALIYSVLGLVIFAGLTMADFQRLRRSTDINSAPLMAASIFLDILNIFQFFLQLFSRRAD